MLNRLHLMAKLALLLSAFPLGSLAAPAFPTPASATPVPSDGSLSDSSEASAEANPGSSASFTASEPTGTDTTSDSSAVSPTPTPSASTTDDLPAITLWPIDAKPTTSGNETFTTAIDGTFGPIDKRDGIYKRSIWTAIHAYALSYGTSGSGQTAFLNWNSGHSFDDDSSSGGAWLQLKVAAADGSMSVSGGNSLPSTSTVAKVDTGSAGIMLVPKWIGGKSNLDLMGATPGYQFYTSNNFLYLGKWVKVQVTLGSGNSGDTNSIVATPSALVVTYQRSSCTGWKTVTFDPNNPLTACPDDPASAYSSHTIADTATSPKPYIGVGWGQLTNPQAGVAVQPFRNVKSINGVPVWANKASGTTTKLWWQGYIFQKDGIQVGMNTGDQCKYYTLPANPAPSMTGDWARPAGCVEINGGGCAQGYVLPDSGINYMINSIGTPYALPTLGGTGAYASALSKGAKMTVYMGGKSLTYNGAVMSIAATITQGDPNSAPATPIHGDFSPSGCLIVSQTPTPTASEGSWTNFGRHIYDIWDTCVSLYGDDDPDNDSGYFGIRSH